MFPTLHQVLSRPAWLPTIRSSKCRRRWLGHGRFRRASAAELLNWRCPRAKATAAKGLSPWQEASSTSRARCICRVRRRVTMDIISEIGWRRCCGPCAYSLVCTTNSFTSCRAPLHTPPMLLRAGTYRFEHFFFLLLRKIDGLPVRATLLVVYWSCDGVRGALQLLDRYCGFICEVDHENCAVSRNQISQ